MHQYFKRDKLTGDAVVGEKPDERERLLCVELRAMLEHSSRNSADSSRVHQKANVKALGDHRTFEAYRIRLGLTKIKHLTRLKSEQKSPADPFE